MKRIVVISLVLAVFSVISYAFIQKDKSTISKKKKPNILFIVVDDLKPLLESYGDENVKTPGMDRLASQGVLFENAYCQQAVCAPSRVSFFTGKRPDRTKVFDLKTNMRDMNPNIITAPQFFKDHGYTTVGLGKLLHGAKRNDPVSWSKQPKKDSKLNYAEGFTAPALDKYQDPKIKAAVAETIAQNLKWRQTKKYLQERKLLPFSECMDVPDDAYADGAIAKEGIKLIKRLSKKEEPFFIALGFHKPHLPFVAPKKYWDMYDEAAIQTSPFQEHAANSPSYAYHTWGEIRAFSDIPNEGPIPNEQQKKVIHAYWASISYVDAQIAKVLDALDKMEVSENTIVVLWGDHGWHLGDHGLWCKHSNFEQATKVPFIIRAPGYAKGKRAKTFAELVDIFPTLVDYAGIEIPDYLEGNSLMPILENPKAENKDYAISQYFRGKNIMGYSIRTKQYRLTLWLKGDFKHEDLFRNPNIAAMELYDYEKDPLETVSQAENPEYSKVVEELKSKLLGLLVEQADKYEIKN
ncbi:MAG: sulfatase [Bacteroidetes bacterium]|nr:MAG: sulfatase [Bacteroidota bacterium]